MDVDWRALLQGFVEGKVVGFRNKNPLFGMVIQDTLTDEELREVSKEIAAPQPAANEGSFKE